MKSFADHNIVGRAIALLGGVTNTNDFLTVRSGVCEEIEAMRIVVREIDARKLQLVTSEYCLETLRRLLVAGGRDFDPIDDYSARQSVNVIRSLAVRSGGLVPEEQVHAHMAEAHAIASGHEGNARGQVDYEDLLVIATLLAAQLDAYDPSILLTQDVGIRNCQPKLLGHHIGVFTACRWNRAYKASLVAAAAA